jgi:hypothetical protein
MNETIKIETLTGLNPADYLTGTVFEYSNGQLWRVTDGGKSFRRMTSRTGNLLKGEERWARNLRIYAWMNEEV